MSLLLALLAQVGPHVSPGPNPVSPLPPEILERERTPAPQASASPPIPGRLSGCLAQVRDDPVAAMDEAWDWRGKARGGARAEAGLCLGMAYAAQERYGEAHAAFLSGLGAADAQDVELRARLAALAGNAALAGGDHQAALDVLGSAETLASAAGSTLLSGGIAIDKARALVALRRLPEAATALATARKADPANAQAWLLSATLSRRLGNLDEAQERIERAGELAPGDPEVGLEAGVIAVLAGRDDAARLSWQSVIDTAPQSAFANQAKEYIAQLQSYDNGSE